MSNKKKKNEEFSFKELTSTPRGKAILFFGAYLIFFFALAILARSGGVSNGTSNNKKYETGSPLQFSLAGISSGNYKFIYTLTVDSGVSTMTGISDGSRERATCTALNEYYKENDNYFTNLNGVWVKTTDPYAEYPFFDVENISDLIETASYVSKTEYESGNDVYTFSISSASINKLFYNADLDIEEVPNEIILGVDEDNYVTEVKFILDSYCKAKGSCTSNMTITLKYEMFGEIEEITSPLV